MRKIILLIAFFAAIAITACIQKQGADGSSEKTVSVMIYSEYIDPALLDDFRDKTGYKVKLELYEAQEEMISKLLMADSGKYDIIIASDVVIQQMVHLGLISPIDTNKIPNHVNVAPQFLGQAYDPTNSYSLPYLWGTTGILFRGDKINPDSVSYSLLFDAKNTKGKFSLLNESRSMLSRWAQKEVLESLLLDDMELEREREGSDIGKDKVISENYWAAIVFSGEAMDAIDADSTLQYAIPKEGSFMWVDAMTLSSKAKNPNGAYAFMNYILDAKIGAQLAKAINYATPNKASLEIMDEEFKNNRVINPNAQEIKRMVFLTDLGEAEKLFDEAWMIVKSH